MLAHDFTQGGSPERHLKRIAEVCNSVGAAAARSPMFRSAASSAGAMSRSWSKLGMEPSHGRSRCRSTQSIVVSNRMLAERVLRLKLPLADTTDDLVQAEARRRTRSTGATTRILVRPVTPRSLGGSTMHLLGRHLEVRLTDRGHHFLSTSSRNVGPRKIQLEGVAEIGPLMPKTAIW